jgi:putative component of toxin-antitoxin plasmid stabilization module
MERSSKKIVEGNFVLNRSLFHTALKDEFEDWLSELRGGNTKARDNLRKRMNQVCEIHFLI